jgi:hypothetical protein
MNNSKLALDSIPKESDHMVEIQEQLTEKEATEIRIIEAIQRIRTSKDWSTLKTELFDELPKKIRKEILAEGRKDDPSTNKLNRLSGELKWAEKYADLSKLEATQRVELQRIRMQLHGK